MLSGIVIPLSRRGFGSLGERQIQGVYGPTSYSVQHLPRCRSLCLIKIGSVLNPLFSLSVVLGRTEQGLGVEFAHPFARGLGSLPVGVGENVQRTGQPFQLPHLLLADSRTTNSNCALPERCNRQ